MVNNQYQLYIESVYNLAQTIVIKFEDAATAINFLVIKNNGIASVSNDPYTWKYYQNMSGVYHFSDSPMIITSLDTLEIITFNKINLSNHPATRAAYEFDTRQYRELLQRFPDQEALILGILYPCNAIAAREGTILSYPTSLVESNEYSFNENLQTLIYNYIDRWINRQFTISDDLYCATYMAQMYFHLVPSIINLRLSACKTNEAHSFHVRQYLASHAMLDVYLDTMTKFQALFFYRNILYIQRNSGKQDTFDWLVDNIMTHRALPLYDFTMKHNVANMLPNDQNEQTLSYYPEITFRRKPINYPTVDPEKTFSSLTQIVTKLNPQARDNPEYQQETFIDVMNTLEDSKSNVVITKLLESSVTDYSDSVPYTLESILLNQWLDWSVSGVYDAYVSLTFPKNKTSIVVSVKDAFIIFIYALNKSIGITPTLVPSVLATRILRTPVATFSDLRNVTDKVYLKDTAITELLSTVPTITTVNSIDAFYKQAVKVFESTQVQYYLCALEEHFIIRGDKRIATSKIYCDKKIQLKPTGTLFVDYLNSLSLSFSDYTGSDFNILATSIFGQTTGLIANATLSIKKIQKAMVDLMTQLSSYSINIVSDVNQTGIVLVQTGSTRLGDILSSSGDETYVGNVPIRILSIGTTVSDKKLFDFNTQYPLTVSHASESSLNTIDPGLSFSVLDYPDIADPTEVELSNITVIAGTDFYNEFNSLTLLQKQSLIDTYR
jgi:hypothetical protein